ncbi:hypothetical protein [Alicyclobacillus tolerans]|uniref:Uncharacterized protein n=1 Tax=Alicyclobacillus tolerans TaxID=90970 RepID=A0A1M6X3C1_9BACL|nr:hypothetical protein [Alicyclobacillus montanus]SHL00438.1 hypothetical protein SAMN05443507_13121 [Alicyclobacillus montanus]
MDRSNTAKAVSVGVGAAVHNLAEILEKHHALEVAWNHFQWAQTKEQIDAAIRRIGELEQR